MKPDNVPIPKRCLARPRDEHGRVIGFFQYIAPDGTPDFRILDTDNVLRCLQRRLCGMCGQPLGKHIYFVGGPLCVENFVFHDPAMHHDCALYPLRACPHLASSKGRFSNPAPRVDMGDTTIIVSKLVEADTKAAWFALMHTTDYTWELARNMLVIHAQRPWLDVQRWKDGKPIDG